MAPSRGSVARSPRTTASPGEREHADAPRRKRKHPAGPVPLKVVAKEWTRIGVTGFGGPAAHVAMLRRLIIDRYEWMDARSFEDANAACGLLPGPGSTQLAIFCAYRVAGPWGAIVGGLGFAVPAVVMVLALSVLFLSSAPPKWVIGIGAGAGAAVAAVAVHAGLRLLGPSFERVRTARGRALRWWVYLLAAAVAAATLGSYLVLVLLACGAFELAWRRRTVAALSFNPLMLAVAAGGVGGFGALAWTAFKVGALSYGGGFVVVPLMQADAVNVYHWMTGGQFLNAVALGQVTPGPIVATVAAVGYAAHGITGGVLAAVVAFTPSFSFILLGGQRFERLRQKAAARAFLDGAGPARIGAILGAAIPLASALGEGWQYAVLAAAAVALLLLRRGVLQTLLAAGAVGLFASVAGAPLPH
jgi:chromate transporter